MTSFLYDGVAVPMIEEPMFAETSWVEKNSGVPLSQMTESDATAMNWLISLRRKGFMLTWADVQEMSPASFKKIPEPEPEPASPAVEGDPEVDPPTAGVEAGAEDATSPSTSVDVAPGS